MRKVTESTVYPFMDREPAACGNTSTDGDRLTLHGHVIAQHFGENASAEHTGAKGVAFTLAGYDTRTTRDRVNAALMAMGYGGNPSNGMPEIHFFRDRGQLFIGTKRNPDGSRGYRARIGSFDKVYVVHPSYVVRRESPQTTHAGCAILRIERDGENG